MSIAEPAESTSDEVPVGNFVRDTHLERDPTTPGRWLGEISEAWRVQFAFGGMSMAVALRAIERELERDDLDLISAHATYCSPISCASVVADARVLRQGKRAAQGVVDLRNADDDAPDLHGVATFGRLDHTHVDIDGPAFPVEAGGPDDWEAPVRPDDDPFPELNFHSQTEFRPCGWPGFDEEWVAEEGYASAWTRLVTPPLLSDGSVDPLAIVVHSDMIGPAIGMRLGPRTDDNPNFVVLTLEIDLQIFRPWTTTWILQQVEAIRAGEGFAAGTLHLWDENHELIGYAVQRAAMRHFTQGDGFFKEG
jgi:acyl-CoA thioesterase